jgi:hypothetical protein
MPKSSDEQERRKIEAKSIYLNRIGAAVAVLSVAAYTLYVITGRIGSDRKIDAVHFGLIVFAVLVAALLLRPSVFERLMRVDVRGVGFEFFKRVEERQAKQEVRLDDLTQILSLLLPKRERDHMYNLAQGTTHGYQYRPDLSTELDHLLSLRLIYLHPGRALDQLPQQGKFNLDEWVALTEQGKRWVEWLIEKLKD